MGQVGNIIGKTGSRYAIGDKCDTLWESKKVRFVNRYNSYVAGKMGTFWGLNGYVVGTIGEPYRKKCDASWEQIAKIMKANWACYRFVV